MRKFVSLSIKPYTRTQAKPQTEVGKKYIKIDFKNIPFIKIIIFNTLFDHLPIVYICENNLTTIQRIGNTPQWFPSRSVSQYRYVYAKKFSHNRRESVMNSPVILNRVLRKVPLSSQETDLLYFDVAAKMTVEYMKHFFNLSFGIQGWRLLFRNVMDFDKTSGFVPYLNVFSYTLLCISFIWIYFHLKIVLERTIK